MFIDTYDPKASGTCPKCGYCDDLYTSGGNLAFGERYLLLWHPKCGTQWTFYIDRPTGHQVEITGENVKSDPAGGALLT